MRIAQVAPLAESVPPSSTEEPGRRSQHNLAVSDDRGQCRYRHTQDNREFLRHLSRIEVIENLIPTIAAFLQAYS
jgi:hypothetical protein